ncbi:18509_t:CDS:1, partial [Gigaspora margarita]
PRMENTQQEQLQDTINRLIALWNQNLLLVEELLTLAENSSITLLQLPNEELLVLVEDNVMLLQPSVEETLVPCDDILLFKDIEISAPVTKNPNQIDDPVDSEKDYSRRIRNDLL